MRLHLSSKCGRPSWTRDGLYPLMRCPWFVPMSILVGFRVDRWQGNNIFLQHTFHFPLSVTIPYLLHIISSIMKWPESLQGTHFLRAASSYPSNKKLPLGFKTQWLLQSLPGLTKFYVQFEHCVFVFWLDLKTNRNFYPTPYQLSWFYNLLGECLLRGMKWITIYHSG